MKPRIILLIFMTILLAACNLPTAASTTPTDDAVATQVSQLLTKIPTATTAPAILPSATRAPDATATDTTPTLTQTLTSTPPADTPTTAPTQANDPPDWMDTLEGGKAFYKYENDNTRVTQEGGHLALTGINANGWLGWSLTFSRKPANFRLETVFTTQACSGTDFYGIIFRAPNANAGYFFGVTCDGHYNLHARDFENDTDTVLVNTTSGTGIIPGSNQTNRLAVRAEGEKISLFANGTLLQEVNDASFSSGSFGAFIAANETTGFTVWMEEVSLWNIP
jgi:hypothetical protein